MPVDFTAIDFETANSHSASACAVGLVRVRDGVVVERADWLIRPPAAHGEFLYWNIKIHGITPDQVAHAQSWEQQLPALRDFVGSDIVVAHNAGFDMGVIRGACAATVQPTPRMRYFCSVQVARKTYELESYKLPLAAAAAGFRDFPHHDALADAEACAAIIVDSARRFDADGIAALAKATGVKINQLKAQPLKL
ncbi:MULTISPECIES: 3'-5' exonuclease [unclassified Leucobacter]|uniref:3'-5' exonuclease n=1 Tax=unclassified Leucobacter TaxID=2621730 RepID=UPI00165D3C42|nr:3'-5' exonuclease [Leucobacter sp. cx-87]